MSESSKLPSDLFSTDGFDGPTGFEAWQESIGVVFDVAPHQDPKALPSFAALIHMYNLGGLLVSRANFNAQDFSRGPRKIVSDNLDHCLVQLYEKGGFIGSASGTDMIVGAGDTQILDLSRPHGSHTKTSATIAIVMPRDTLVEVLPPIDNFHGMVLRGRSGLGALLADFMKSLHARLGSISLEEAPLLARSTVEMIGACFHPTAKNLGAAQPEIDRITLDRIKQYIARNLRSSALSPDDLSRAMRVSRARLYRMFEPLGGVAKYVQDRRLARAFSDLRDPTQSHRRVFEIAFDLGFGSEAHFSRAFRRKFAVSPSEVRDDLRQVSGSHPPEAQSSGEHLGYEEWIRHLRAH